MYSKKQKAAKPARQKDSLHYIYTFKREKKRNNMNAKLVLKKECCDRSDYV